MSILGNNLLAQYYAQNQGYVKTPSLWIEADSWGTTTWTNKGNGGYDLSMQYNASGYRDGNAIIADLSHPIRYHVARNVVGAGSFTIECAASPSNKIQNNRYGGWLCCQRTTTNAQANSMQMYFYNTLKYYTGGFDSNENAIVIGMNGITITPDIGAYYCMMYDADNNILLAQMNNIVESKELVGWSCLINDFSLGGLGWVASTINDNYLGKIYSFRVYQRTLSEYERSVNRSIDRRRFNF